MSGETILIVDDDVFFCELAGDRLRADGLEVRVAQDLASAERQLDERVALLVVDQRLPDGQGLSLVKTLRDRGHHARALVVTGYPQVGDAVEALRLGIDDYLTKPIDLETLRLSVLRSLETVRLEHVDRLVRRERAVERQARIAGDGLEEVRRLVGIAAQEAMPVLITGATGTGKSLAAMAIHHQGRHERPFVKVNCAAIPETLVEAELFGVEKGAFTGAGASREGLFELANGGTLFLDEIGELEPGVQAKLLGVLEDGAVRRVGGSRDRRFSVRVIAATNVDVVTAMEKGRFRQDLYFRLNFQIEIPPLRSRLGDLPELIAVLLAALPTGRGGKLATGEEDRLRAYPWPGNVRELRNVLERSLLIHPVDALAPSQLLPTGPEWTKPGADLVESGPLETLEAVEMAHIRRMVDACGGNRTRAAEVLGIGLATLRRRLNRSN